MTVTDRALYYKVDSALASLADGGTAVIADVLTTDEAAAAFEALMASSDESERRGVPKHIAALDPNAANVRVFNLIDLDPLFARLIEHPIADGVVAGVLGSDYIVSNFTANIARPGSESMVVHSDLAAVMPEPWTSTLSCNIIWCLTDIHADNGATMYISGSHRYRSAADVPVDPIANMVPFEAAAGSVVVMDGSGTPPVATSPPTRTGRSCSATTPSRTCVRNGTSPQAFDPRYRRQCRPSCVTGSASMPI